MLFSCSHSLKINYEHQMLRSKLMKAVQGHYTENYKTLLTDRNKDLIKWGEEICS